MNTLMLALGTNEETSQKIKKQMLLSLFDLYTRLFV